MTRDEALARMTDTERDTPLSDLLLTVGVSHGRSNDAMRRELTDAAGNILGRFSFDEALALYVERRDERHD